MRPLGIRQSLRSKCRARGLAKVYRSGEVEVHTLRGQQVIVYPPATVGDGERVSARPP